MTSHSSFSSITSSKTALSATAHLFTKVSTATVTPTLIAKDSSTLVHSDEVTICNLITKHCYELLGSSNGKSTAVNNAVDSAYVHHVFTHLVQTGTSTSGKPLLEPVPFSLCLQPNTSHTSIQITTIPDDDRVANTPDPAPITGLITLIPDAFNTTHITLHCTLATPATNIFDALDFKDTSQQTHAPLTHILSLLPTLHARFARYDEVDQVRLSAFEDQIGHPAPIQPHEDTLIASSLHMHATDTTPWQRLKNTARSSVHYFHKTTPPHTWGKAVAIVDAPAAHVFATRWCLDSYENVRKKAKTEEGALWKVFMVPESRSMVTANLTKLGLGVKDRCFVTWFSWRREDSGDFIIAFAPADEYANQSLLSQINDTVKQDPLASTAVKGALKGYWRFRPLAPTICDVTYVASAHLGGSISTELITMRKKQTLSLLRTVQDKHERNSKVVDQEMRKAFERPPRVEELDEGQMEVVDRALESTTGKDWEPLKSPSPFLVLSKKYATPEKGERSTALGRATLAVDCPLLEAAAWWFLFMSRENKRRSYEQGDPALLLVREHSKHDQVIATIKKMPFPLHNREFVGRQVCAMDTNGDLLITYVHVDDVVDYGMSARTVRGSNRAILRFTPVGDSQCSVTYSLHMDAGGVIPTWVVDKKLPLALSGLSDLRDEFERDDEFDKLEWDELARTIRDEPQTYTARELEVLRVAREQLASVNEDDMREMQSPDCLVTMSFVSFAGSDDTVLRASTVIDQTVETCAAFESNLMDRWHLKESHQNGEIERQVVEKTGHASVFQLVLNLDIPGFEPREMVLQNVWKWEREGKLILIQVSTEHERFPMRRHFVRGEVAVIWTYEQLPPLNGIPQTQVTYALKFDLKGAVPKWVVTLLGADELMYLSRIRAKLDRSSEVDLGARTRFVEMIEEHDDEYTEEEIKLLEEGEKHFAEFKKIKAKSLKMASPLTTAEISFEKKDRGVWGRATTTVRASPEEVLAFMWDTTSRSRRSDLELEKAVEARPNGHSLLYYSRKKSPIEYISDREFLTRALWREEEDGSLLLAVSPESSSSRPESGKVVRAKNQGAMSIKWLNDRETVVSYAIHPDAGGPIPSFLMTRSIVKSLSTVTEIQEYFQSLRGLAEWDADDGRCVGELLCIKTKAEKRPEKGENKQSSRMQTLFAQVSGLSEIGRKYEFFQPMMARVVRNTLKPTGDVKSKLCSVSLKEGETIGRGLAMALAGNLTAEAGVDQWILKFGALRQLDEEEAWFRPMINVVAKRLLGEVSWGLKGRVIMGAGLSTLDMATDIFVVVGYMGKEETTGYGWSLLGMVVASMVLQILTVIIQNRKTPLKMLGEMAVVMTGLKPGLDCYKVVSAKEMDKHGAFDATTELTMNKGIEMACESIPGSVLQIYVLMKDFKQRQKGAIASVVVSALTTGFISATISFDYDVDPKNRKAAPEFYGYIPDDGTRAVIFVCMMLNSALLLLIRSFSSATLMLVGRRYLVMYMAGDMAFFLLQRVVRGDFHHWLPLDGALDLFVSLIVRVLVKTITDFTGVIHFRGPQDLGGSYWTVNMFMSLLASFACVWVGGGAIAWTLVGVGSGAWLLTFGLILLIMKKEYRRTFFSTKTAKQATMDKFKVEDDAVKASLLKKNKHHWKAIRGDVKEWVLENYWRWEEERPKWFTASWIAKVPIDMIPAAGQVRVKERRKGGVVGKQVQVHPAE